jgi:hypothetical protein
LNTNNIHHKTFLVIIPSFPQLFSKGTFRKFAVPKMGLNQTNQIQHVQAV